MMDKVLETQEAIEDSGIASDDEATGVVSDEDVYRARHGDPNFEKYPSSIYFYYLGGPIGSPGVKHYHDYEIDGEILPSDLPGRIRSLALNAQRNGNSPPQDGEGAKFRVWRRKSYIVALIAHPGARFRRRDEGGAVEFDPATRNHTFFDAEHLEIDVSADEDGSQVLSAFYCINYMKQDQQGTDLDRRPQEFKFQLKAVPRKPHPVLDLAWLLGPDDGGTNMGPPVPPP